MTRLELAVEQIVFARNYTIELLDQTPVAEWFRQPPGGVSHVGWQVGHPAYAEYRLALWRIRGAQPQDGELISEAHRGLFGYESVPDPDPDKYPSPADLRAVFDRVHEQVLREVRSLDEGELDRAEIYRLARQHVKRFACYDLRHGFAQRMLEKGVNHLAVAELMGHTTGRMVAETYSHMNRATAHLKEALRKGSSDVQT